MRRASSGARRPALVAARETPQHEEAALSLFFGKNQFSLIQFTANCNSFFPVDRFSARTPDLAQYPYGGKCRADQGAQRAGTFFRFRKSVQKSIPHFSSVKNCVNIFFIAKPKLPGAILFQFAFSCCYFDTFVNISQVPTAFFLVFPEIL